MRKLPAETGDRPLDEDVASATALLPALAGYAPALAG
jgi:hypothetical protein